MRRGCRRRINVAHRHPSKTYFNSLLGLDAQRATVEVFAYANGGPGALLSSYVEVEAGRRSDRPQLAIALGAARITRATLLIAQLDRLARNVAFIADLMDARCEFVAIDQPSVSKFTLHTLLAAAEDDTRRISERTKAALAAAKARGIKLGSPIAAETAATARAARSAYASKANETTRAMIRDVQASGVSTLVGIARALQARGVRTPAGCSRWRPVQVSRLIAV